jgi:hypothetical protein
MDSSLQHSASAPLTASSASSAWTEGPWEVIEPDENGQAVVKGKHTEVATCWHHCVGSIEKQMHANARLIAAAPELYAALSGMVGEFGPVRDDYYMDREQDTIDAARAALRKATTG